MRPSDPRIRQTLNHITQNLESANESAQEGIYAFSHNYISPCLSSIGSCLAACTSPCLPLRHRDETLRRRKRGRSRGNRGRGRAELNFDFYDDWEWEYDYDYDYEEDGGRDGSGAGLLTWGHDELERLLAGSSSGDQPRRNRRMSYGARRKGTGLLPADERQDPTVIPSSSVLGFLERFPWRIGKRGVRYRPSGADLQENPGKGRMEREPLLEGSDEGESDGGKGAENVNAQTAGRQRSATQSSRETSNSMSSRGDLFPSDDEEDAIPLDDEFAMALGPRLANDDEHRITRRSTSGTEDSKSTRSKGKGKTRRKGSHLQSPALGDTGTVGMPTLEDLKREEERARIEEEMEIERKRHAAEKLALERGLHVQGQHHDHDKVGSSFFGVLLRS